MKSILGVFWLILATPAYADFDAASYPPYETCALCHGLFGESHLDKFPHLAGQKPRYIRAQLDAFLAGHRTNDRGQMSAIVTELQPQDFDVVVTWFSEQDPPPAGAPPPDQNGMRLAQTSGCLDCHDSASDATVPHLTAQHAGYLAKQMRDFRDGRRTHGAAAAMHQNLLSKMQAGIDDIALYLASLERTE